MHSPGVVELKQFYASPLGQVSARILSKAIRRLWNDAAKETLLGLGYALPYMDDAQNSFFALMPATQGAAYWPIGKANRSAMIEESRLPIADNTINRLMLIHSVENTEQIRTLMKEAWRLLTPGGRMIIIAPSRRGVWSRAAASPFAHGQPFTPGQLRRRVEEVGFTVLHTHKALFIPPVSWNWMLRLAGVVEWLGSKLCSGIGGVVVMQAEKQIYAIRKEEVHRNQPVYVSAIQPVALGFKGQ